VMFGDFHWFPVLDVKWMKRTVCSARTEVRTIGIEGKASNVGRGNYFVEVLFEFCVVHVQSVWVWRCEG
jgi:hypothetical protein